MRLVVTLEHRFAQTPSGEIWSSGQYPRAFWDRYLDVFEEVNVVARVRAVPEIPHDWQRADGACVSFSPVPHYVGPGQYLLRARRVSRSVQSAVRPTDAVIMRVPSQIAACLEPLLKRRGQSYAVEVVDDPFARFSAGATSHPLRPAFQQLYTRRLRRFCVGACGAAYVTRAALQERYPCPAHMTSYSSIDLDAGAFAAGPRVPRLPGETARIVTVGTLENPRKGVDILLEAIALCVREGSEVQLTIVGDGAYRPSLESRAASLGLENTVHFEGQVASPAAVRELIRQADLFVLASLSEGVPRAMIEAMALGLPCVGTAVGGIPELLPADALVEPSDPRSLADRIISALRDPAWLQTHAEANLKTAHEYRSEGLRPRRAAFYSHVRAATEARLRERGRTPKPRVVYVINGLRTGGTERHLVRLITELVRRDTWHISVYCMYRSGPFVQPLEKLGVAVVGPEQPWRWSVMHVGRALWQLYRYLRRERPAIVHCYLTLGNAFGAVAARMAGVPHVVTSRRGPSQLFRSRKHEVLRHRLPLAVADRCSDVIVAVSEAERQQAIRERTPAEKIVVVHNSVAIPERHARRSDPMHQDALVVGSVGRLVPEKGYQDLIRALPEIVEALPDVRLVLVGDGDERSTLERLATDLGVNPHVTFLGERGDITCLLTTFDIFVLPSLLEGVPNALLEAMAMELPVVATRVGGVPEIVEDQVSGVLVDSRSPQQIAGAVIDLGRDRCRRAQLGAGALSHVRSRFDMRQEIDRTETVYRRLIGGTTSVA